MTIELKSFLTEMQTSCNFTTIVAINRNLGMLLEVNTYI